MDVQEEIQTFIRLGLTCNQSKVYLNLAKVGTSTANAISKQTGIDRSEVYRLMLTLGKLGLVEKKITTPVKFTSTPVHDALSLLMSRRVSETSDLDQKARELLRDFRPKEPLSSVIEDSQFIMIPEKETSIQRRRKAIENAQVSIDAVNSWKRFPLLMSTYVDEIRNALQRGVKIRTVTDQPKNQMALIGIDHFKETSAFQVKYQQTPPEAVVTIYDSKEVIMTTSSTKALGESSFLWSNNSSLLTLAKGYFDVLWENAQEYDDVQKSNQ